MLRSVLFGLLQLAAGVAAALALYHLIGLWPAVLIVSVVVGLLAVLAEIAHAQGRPLVIPRAHTELKLKD